VKLPAAYRSQPVLEGGKGTSFFGKSCASEDEKAGAERRPPGGEDRGGRYRSEPLGNVAEFKKSWRRGKGTLERGGLLLFLKGVGWWPLVRKVLGP